MEVNPRQQKARNWSPQSNSPWRTESFQQPQETMRKSLKVGHSPDGFSYEIAAPAKSHDLSFCEKILKCEPLAKSGPDSWPRETEITNICFFKLLGFRVICYTKTCLRVTKNPRQFLFFWFLNQNGDREVHCWNSNTMTYVVLVMVTWLLISKVNN